MISASEDTHVLNQFFMNLPEEKIIEIQNGIITALYRTVQALKKGIEHLKGSQVGDRTSSVRIKKALLTRLN